MSRDFRRFAKAAALAAWDKKALEITVLDLRNQSDVADYVVIAGVESSAQMVAVEESIDHDLKKAGLARLHRDGRGRGRWMVADYGGLLVHVMQTQAREFYRLESLWEHPKTVSWLPAAKVSKKAKKKKA